MPQITMTEAFVKSGNYLKSEIRKEGSFYVTKLTGPNDLKTLNSGKLTIEIYERDLAVKFTHQWRAQIMLSIMGVYNRFQAKAMEAHSFKRGPNVDHTVTGFINVALKVAESKK